MDTVKIRFSYENCMDFPVVYVILGTPTCMGRLNIRLT
jgi:hypothetical protein